MYFFVSVHFINYKTDLEFHIYLSTYQILLIHSMSDILFSYDTVGNANINMNIVLHRFLYLMRMAVNSHHNNMCPA